MVWKLQHTTPPLWPTLLQGATWISVLLLLLDPSEDSVCCGADTVFIRPCFSGLFLKAFLSAVCACCGWFHSLMILMSNLGVYMSIYTASSTGDEQHLLTCRQDKLLQLKQGNQLYLLKLFCNDFFVHGVAPHIKWLSARAESDNQWQPDNQCYQDDNSVVVWL